MALVTFYEKPGCINHARQKKLLKQAGHSLIEMNLLTEPWTATRLRPFFAALPVAEWFNRSAPRIKSGEILPGEMDENGALALMLADPLLIRRPLIHCDGSFMCGFDDVALVGMFGESICNSGGDPETCMQPEGQACDVRVVC